VKRNRAQMPSQLGHARPTAGDWLKKRYIVNNYIMLDTLGVGSYGEVRMCKVDKHILYCTTCNILLHCVPFVVFSSRFLKYFCYYVHCCGALGSAQ
jgi:hypothetical protein